MLSNVRIQNAVFNAGELFVLAFLQNFSITQTRIGSILFNHFAAAYQIYRHPTENVSALPLDYSGAYTPTEGHCWRSEFHALRRMHITLQQFVL